MRDKSTNSAISFLIKSIDKKSGGSRAFYSSLLYPINKWSDPYPETTGYILATFVRYSVYDDKYKFLDKYSETMASWLLNIQHEDGAFPGHLFNEKNKHTKSIFNSAQIIKGLYEMYIYTKESKYLLSVKKCAQWIANSQNENGSWTKYAYNSEFSPTYYTRVTWPLLQANSIESSELIYKSAIKGLDFVLSKKIANGYISDMGFTEKDHAFLHTIAYTLEGLIMSYKFTNKIEYFNLAYELSEKLLKIFEIKKRLAGHYNKELKGDYSYICITGYSQMAIVWGLIYEITDDLRFYNSMLKILDINEKLQTKYSLFFKNGGFTGSKPFYKDYIKFRQPNWAAKFYLDAILLENKLSKKI